MTSTLKLWTKIKYLGIILDSERKFCGHADYLKRMLIGRIKMLEKLRPLVGQDISLNLYKTMVLPVLDYTDIVYDCLRAKYCTDLQKIQNYAMRIILQWGIERCSAEMHCVLELQRLSDRRHCHTLHYVYKCQAGEAPVNVASQLTQVENVHNRNTCSSTRHDLSMPVYNLQSSRRSFRYRGPFYWNITDTDSRSSTTLRSLKQALKESDMFGIN